MTMTKAFGWLLEALLVLSFGHGLPLGGRDAKSLDANVEKYLTRFGYLSASSIETGAQWSEKQLRDAIRNLQFFAGINVTGQVDEATRTILKKPRCGVPDVSHSGYRNRRYALQGERWSHTNLTWSLKKLPPLKTDVVYIDRELIRRELSYALELWAKNSRLSFTERPHDDPKSDIQVFFFREYHGDGYPFDGPGTILAHAFFPGSGRGGDVHFDADEHWSAEPKWQSRSKQSITSLFSVAAHEFGHSLGLSHSSVDSSLMFPWYSSTVMSHDFQLPKDDLEAIQYLYGDAEEAATGPVPGPTLKDTQDPMPYPKEPEHSPEQGHQDEQSTTEVPARTASGPPDECQTGFDAVAVIRGEMWAFKGKYFWRLNSASAKGSSSASNVIQRGDPVELSAFWYGLPTDQIDKIDAVYERPDHKIVFFIGKQFYILTGNSLLDQGPVPLTQIGLPASLDRVDAAFRWGWNGRTYLFSGHNYWRFDETMQHVELDYPRDLSIWKGVPTDFDTVFQHTDGKTYFFKGPYFWEYNDLKMQVRYPKPMEIGQRWMYCPRPIKDPFPSLSSSAHLFTSSSSLYIFAFLCHVFLPLNPFLRPV